MAKKCVRVGDALRLAAGRSGARHQGKGDDGRGAGAFRILDNLGAEPSMTATQLLVVQVDANYLAILCVPLIGMES